MNPLDEQVNANSAVLLWRMEKLRPDYPGLERMRRAINDRIFWGKRTITIVPPNGRGVVKKEK